MTFGSPHSPETREAVEAMLRESSLTMLQVSDRMKVPYATVRSWNQQLRIRRRSRKGGPGTDPRGWTPARLGAAARLFCRPDIDQGDLAEAMGARRDQATDIVRACGLAAEPGRPPPGHAPDPAALDAALRAHIAEQIAASTERLRREGAGDTARVLRDLGGLNRLLDDLAGRARQRQRSGDADGEPEPDLDALRDRIARRYESFEAERRYARVCEGPGEGPPRDPGD